MSIKSENTPISEATPIRVGLIIVVLAGLLSAFGSSIWWASNISTKLETLISLQTALSSSVTELKAADIAIYHELNDFKLKIALQEVQLKSLQDKIQTKTP